MRPLEVRLRDLPDVFPHEELGGDFVRVGGWTIDPAEEWNADEAWENAKAWAAYAHWLQTK